MVLLGQFLIGDNKWSLKNMFDQEAIFWADFDFQGLTGKVIFRRGAEKESSY